MTERKTKVTISKVNLERSDPELTDTEIKPAVSIVILSESQWLVGGEIVLGRYDFNSINVYILGGEKELLCPC